MNVTLTMPASTTTEFNLFYRQQVKELLDTTFDGKFLEMISTSRTTMPTTLKTSELNILYKDLKKHPTQLLQSQSLV